MSTIEETILNGLGPLVHLDLSLNNYFKLELIRDTKLNFPVNIKENISGYIKIIHHIYYPKNLSFDSCYKFTCGITPSLTKEGGAVDILYFNIMSSDQVICNLIKNVKPFNV